ncbi:SRPBCC family protein [Accumulibacter sp.]|uniref:SRPBCC family protein n=1 Tax=Accumulibacter sp. TaxID=2053492 RepID=UPI00261B7B49|nr:SRPBCC family protein [Accumulibacter sp.]
MSDPARSLAAPCSDRRRGWLLLAMLGLAFGAGLAATPAIDTTTAVTIDVALDDETYVVHASAQVAADQELVWGTLTDYQRLREFVPGVTRARVLDRTGNLLTIEQVGVFSVLFVELPVQLRLLVRHTPYSTVLATLAASSAASEEATLRSFTGRYSLTPILLPERAGVRLDYDARFALARPLPPLIGSLFGVGAVRRTMREQFEAMLREIARRQAAAAAG